MGAPGRGRGFVTGRHASRVSQAPEVLGEYPMGCLAEELETPGPGQVRALVTVASNPVLSAPNGARIARALEGLDFMVSVDIYVNETTRHADVILPGGGPFEEPHYDVSFSQLSCRNHARYSGALLEAAPGAQAEWQALARLAALLRGREDAMSPGFDLAAFDAEMLEEDLRRAAGALPAAQLAAVMAALGPAPGPDRLLDLGLRTGPYGDLFGMKPGGISLATVKAQPHGVDLGPLAPRLPGVLRTASGTIEAWPAAAAGELDDVEAMLLHDAAPLVVVGRRDVRSNNSWMHNLPVLAKGPERCTALMNPQDAAALGLATGDRVRLKALRGDAARAGAAIELPVVATADMMPGVVSVPHGWGHDLEGVRLAVAGARPGANLNALLDETLRDRLSGTSVLGGVPVVAERVG
jgi:anaerobic selenocysteine-containing dehydrogenase